MDELVAVVGGFVVFVAVIFALIFAGVSYSCNGYEEVTGKPTRVVAFECYVQDEGNWYIWEEYKYRLATKGEFAR